MSYAIYIGKNRTATGAAFLAGYGDEPSSHWLEIVNREQHASGSTIEVGVTPNAAMPGVRTRIPQVPETFRHLRVSYSYYLGVPGPLSNGGLNEYGVAVRDVWSPTCERLTELTPKDQQGPNYSDLAKIVLERAKTARHGASLIGELVETHGYSTYGGNSHLIADADEAWVVIEFAGDKGLWVAERLGADDIRVSRPGYILEIPADYQNHPDFMGAQHLITYAAEMSWYRSADGAFNVNDVYGDGKGRWAGVDLMEAELASRADSVAGLHLSDVMWALRDPRITGDSAGYGQIVPLTDYPHPQLRIMWHAAIGAIAAPFTPFFLGIDTVPPEFQQHRYLSAGEDSAFVDTSSGHADSRSAVPQGIEATRAAVASFKRLLYAIAGHHAMYLDEVTSAWEALEQSTTAAVSKITDIAQVLLDAGEVELARHLLTYFCETEAVRGLDLGEAMLTSIEARSRVRFGIPNSSVSWIGPEQIW